MSGNADPDDQGDDDGSVSDRPDLSALIGSASAPSVNPLDGMDLGGLLASAQEMMAGVQAAADAVVEGSAGGGLVTIAVDGHFDVKSVTIDPGAVDPDDISLLEDLVLAALRDASEQLRNGQTGAIGGIDLGGFGGLLGGE